MVGSWGALTFDRVATIAPDSGPDGRPSRLNPADRYRESATSKIHRYGGGPFCRFALRGLSNESGVYVLTVDGNPVYVGECQSLAQRWGLSGYGSIQPRNCFKGGQETNCRINNLVYQEADRGSNIELWFRQSGDRKSEEAALIRQMQPAWNLRK
jgi:hypothetical protein